MCDTPQTGHDVNHLYSSVDHLCMNSSFFVADMDNAMLYVSSIYSALCSLVFVVWLG